MRYLSTKISLPPGPPAGALIKEFLQLAFAKYRWFVPMRYGGFAIWDQKIDPERIDYDALVAVYEERQSLCVATRTDKDFLCIFPARADSPPHKGKIIWEASASYSSKASWRKAHAEQVAEVMTLLRSPLAMAARDEDVERKTIRLVPSEDGVGSVQTFTVSNYSQGLAGLFWRNFFGPPFVRMFGERLASLPAEYRQELGNGLVLVQPYALPSDAGTEQGNAQERSLIEHLGPECFYNHARHLKPSRVPMLEDSGA